MGRAGISLEPDHLLQRADAVVVEQKAQWCSADTGQVTGTRIMASVFIVRDGWVMCVVRYPDLANAVHAASFDGSYGTRSA